MTESADAKRIKREAKALKARRARWLGLSWQRSTQGNAWIDTRDNFHVVVFHRDGHWSARVVCNSTLEQRASQRRYPTASAAKLAAFDAMTDMKAKRAAKLTQVNLPASDPDDVVALGERVR